jgi:uncharacterized protein (DUF58 family)
VTDYGPLLEEVRRLRWRARGSLAGALPGAHPSRRRGSSAEFAEYRPYRQGDPLARVDWKLFARTDRAYLRLSPDRTVLSTMMVVDASASMDFPERDSKLERARQLAVALAAVVHQEGDPAGVAVAGDRISVYRPRTRGGVVGDIAHVLDAARPGDATSVVEALGAALRAARRVVLLSDMLTDDQRLVGMLRAHVARGSEAYVVHIVAAEELEPAAGVVHDPESQHERRVLDPDGIEHYCESFFRWREELATRCRAAGIAYALTRTDEAVAPDVRRIVALGGSRVAGR